MTDESGRKCKRQSLRVESRRTGLDASSFGIGPHDFEVLAGKAVAGSADFAKGLLVKAKYAKALFIFFYGQKAFFLATKSLFSKKLVDELYLLRIYINHSRVTFAFCNWVLLER